MCTHRCAWHLPGYKHISIPVCAMCPHIPTYVHTCIHVSTYQIYNNDIDIVTYMHIQAYRGTPVRTKPSIHACMYIPTYAHAQGDGLPTNADGAADARVRVRIYTRHPHVLGCTSVDTGALCADGHRTRARARTHAHAPMESTRTVINAHILLHVDVCT